MMKRDLLTKVLTIGGFLLLFSGYIAFKTGYFDSLFASERKPETPLFLQSVLLNPVISPDSTPLPGKDTVIQDNRIPASPDKPAKSYAMDPALMSSKSITVVDLKKVKWFFELDSNTADSVLLDSLLK